MIDQIVIAAHYFFDFLILIGAIYVLLKAKKACDNWD
jgi:hypothetical protein